MRKPCPETGLTHVGLMQPSSLTQRLSWQEKSQKMLCFTSLLVLVLALLAGSPLLLADRAQRRFTKMQRNRLSTG